MIPTLILTQDRAMHGDTCVVVTHTGKEKSEIIPMSQAGYISRLSPVFH